ncbi:MAG: hypothetical protein KIT14_14625 [bacterium]|nr:hypothetical protein [bacterium]
MAEGTDAGFAGLLRNRFVLIGVLLFGVGLADMVTGRIKVDEYRVVLRTTPRPTPAHRNPTALFPRASEAEQQIAIAQTKLGYYQLLFLVGQALAALGLLSIAVGAFQIRLRTMRAGPAPHPSA